MSLPISGFTAVPNPQMLSYMMSQSWIMMYAAGGAWQYGKRRISAMSNQEFNALTPINLLKEHTTMLREAIPSIQESLNDMTPLIKTLMEQFGDFIHEALKAIPQTVSNILGTPTEFSNIPTTANMGGSGNLPPQMMGFLHFFKALSDQTKGLPDDSDAIERARKQAELEAAAKHKEDMAKLQAISTVRTTGITSALVDPAEHALRQKMGNKSRQSLRIKFQEESKNITKLTQIYFQTPKLAKSSTPQMQFRPGKRPLAVFGTVTNPAKGVALRNLQKAQQWIIDIQKWFKLKGWRF